MILVIHGDVLTGLQFVGPFADLDSAGEWGHRHLTGEFWLVAPITAPILADGPAV